MSLLSTRGLTKSYAGVTANSDINFDLPKGQTRALIGPNGAGKSTFVGMISGRIEATSGTVTLAGEDISNLPAHQRIAKGIAYTFQITSVFGGLSVTENIALAARRHLGAAAPERVAEVLDQVGLTDRADQTARDLSYGHQRILEIGMGLAQNPRLFILDEPTQGLAEAEIDAFKTLIRALDPATTILLIEHNMSVVMDLADTITVLDQGRILAEGTPPEIRANAAVQAAYLGTEHA